MASRMNPRGFLWVFFVLILLNPVTLVAQGLPQSPYSAASMVRGGLDLAPSNPLASPTGVRAPGMGSILLTPQIFRGILPQPANLQAGYLYSFGESVGSGRLTLDFTQPVVFGNSAVFGEAHTAFQDFWKTVTGGANNRVDLSFGGGYRTLLNDNTLLGFNGFFDSTKLGGRWYSSGSVGCEMAALIAGSDAIDLTFNWYGNLFNSDALANTFRNGSANYDFQVGYSHELWNGGPDFRLFGTGYRFSAGSDVYGIKGGVELKSRDGMFSFKYEAANDRVNQTYHTVGGFVNVGVQLSNLLNGESPFVAPEPIFRSPRNLRRLLSRKVHRSYVSVSPPANVSLTGMPVIASGCPYQCAAPPPAGLLMVWSGEISEDLDNSFATVPLIPEFELPVGNYDFVICVQNAPSTNGGMATIVTSNTWSAAWPQGDSQVTISLPVSSPLKPKSLILHMTAGGSWYPGCVTIYVH